MAAGGIRCCRISISKSSSSCCSDIGFYPYSRTRERTQVRVCYLMDSSTTSFNFKFVPASYSLRRFSASGPEHPVNVRCMQAKSNPRLCHFSQREDDHGFFSDGLVSVAGGVVALGKFDALHIGHRELAIQASKAGIPFLLSFVGMAEVFGWEQRAPIVAKCDRKRILSSWSPYCGSVPPTELHVEFSSVRHLNPRQFVEKLAKELGVRGVVAGENYRFGYKAAGDAAELVNLCEEYGMEAYIVGTILDKKQSSVGIRSSLDPKDKGQVSSTRVRQALADGDVRYVSELLGRRHRLVMVFAEEKGFICKDNMLYAPKTCLLNLPPTEGLYENCNCIFGNTLVVGCSATIDATHIHVESTQQFPFQEYTGLIGLEFGGAEEVSN